MSTKIEKNPTKNNNEAKVIVAEIAQNGEITEKKAVFQSVEEAEKRADLLSKKIKNLNYLKENAKFIQKVLDYEEEEEFCIVLINKQDFTNMVRNHTQYTIVKKQEIVLKYSEALLTYTETMQNELEKEILNNN